MAIKIVLIVILVILAFPILWVTLAKVVRKLVHFPAPAFIGRLLDSGYRIRIQHQRTEISRILN
jgi:hypothetical protein